MTLQPSDQDEMWTFISGGGGDGGRVTREKVVMPVSMVAFRS